MYDTGVTSKQICIKSCLKEERREKIATFMGRNTTSVKIVLYDNLILVELIYIYNNYV